MLASDPRQSRDSSRNSALLGVYLEDERQLVWTVDVADRELICEDCSVPADQAPRVVRIDQNTACRWRTVRGGVPVAHLLLDL